MSIATDYGRSFVPPVWRVLGKTLKPLTPRHVMVLSGIGNALSPLEIGKEAFGPAALAMAVEVCGRTGHDAVRFVVRTKPWALRWILRWRREHFRLDRRTWYPVAQFIAYRRFWYHDKPEVQTDPEKSNDSEVPGLLGLIAQLVSQGCDRDSVMDTPCRVLFWDSLFSADAAKTLRVKEQTGDRIALRDMARTQMTKEERSKFADEMMQERKKHLAMQREERNRRG